MIKVIKRHSTDLEDGMIRLYLVYIIMNSLLWVRLLKVMQQ